MSQLDQDIAARLRLAMERRGLTANGLAVRLQEARKEGSRTSDMIRKYLSGSSAGVEFLVSAAELLEVPAHWLILGEGEIEEGWDRVITNRGTRYRLTLWVQNELDLQFKDWKRLGAFAYDALWETWAHFRRVKFSDAFDSPEEFEIASREAARTVSRSIVRTAKEADVDLATLEQPELDQYVVDHCRALLSLLDVSRLRESRYSGVRWVEEPKPLMAVKENP